MCRNFWSCTTKRRKVKASRVLRYSLHMRGVLFAANKHQISVMVHSCSRVSEEFLKRRAQTTCTHFVALWRWSVMLICDIDLWHWPVTLTCDVDLWRWPVTLTCDIDLWHWSVTLTCDVDLWHWPMTLTCDWHWPVTLTCDVDLWRWLWHWPVTLTCDIVLWHFAPGGPSSHSLYDDTIIV